MLTMTPIARLRAVPLFDGLPDAALALLDDTMWRRYATGDVLIDAGASETAIFVILSGRVAIELDRIRIAGRGANEIVGEQSFIDGQPHSAIVRASEMVTALRLPPELVRAYQAEAAFRESLLKVVSTKLREATADRWERYAEHERLFAEFGAHVGPEARDALLRAVRTGGNFGAARHADVFLLYSDLRGFTAASEAVDDPIDVANALTMYFDDMVNIIHRHGGWVDKYVGDAILAVWNMPGLDRASADDVLQAAIDMINASRRHRLGDVELRTGVGLNAGRVFMGNVGSARKRQFTVIGAPVNLAARLEGKSKTLGDVVCGPAFVSELGESARRSLTPTEPQEIAGVAGDLILHVYRENA